MSKMKNTPETWIDKFSSQKLVMKDAQGRMIYELTLTRLALIVGLTLIFFPFILVGAGIVSVVAMIFLKVRFELVREAEDSGMVIHGEIVSEE